MGDNVVEDGGAVMEAFLFPVEREEVETLVGTHVLLTPTWGYGRDRTSPERPYGGQRFAVRLGPFAGESFAVEAEAFVTVRGVGHRVIAVGGSASGDWNVWIPDPIGTSGGHRVIWCDAWPVTVLPTPRAGDAPGDGG